MILRAYLCCHSNLEFARLRVEISPATTAVWVSREISPHQRTNASFRLGCLITRPDPKILQAHEHYRAKRYPEAIAGALKSFESTMKGICDTRNWNYPGNVTAKGLIEVIFSKELIPSSLVSQFSGLRSVLESGLPTVRNKQGGHGQGKDPVAIPSHLAAYALHLAASNIVMLLEAHKALK